MIIEALVVALLDGPTQDSGLRTQDSITVTATRTSERLADTPASVVILNRQAIAATAAPTVDDALRQVPGFSLFRRAGSRTANPTAQGASLRGLGGSGTSRALVLDDGVPLNDPFGGWIFWGRVPRASLDRIEILRGGASDVYGSGAMSGVVQFIRRKDDMAIDVDAGSQRTATGSLFVPLGHGDWSGNIASDFLTTDGYVLVEPSQRGAVDRAASSRHLEIDGTLRHNGFFARASRYTESRNNGTPLQINDTILRQIALGFDRGPLVIRLDGNSNDYHQTFSAIAAGRATERLTVDQRVPSHSVGGSAQWRAAIGRAQALIAGVEGREVGGTDEEPPSRVAGHQRTAAFYVEDIADIGSRVNLTAGIRSDRWSGKSALSPRVSILVRATDRIAFTAAAYRAFRAPTLNELYRSFRVGNVVTLANGALGPENLTGFEVGARGGPFRITLFNMTLTDAITNVTLTTTPALITRQRENFGSSRSRGAEIEYSRLLRNGWSASLGYLFADATLSTGARTPQVPRNQATLQLSYRSLAGVQGRWSSMQFDDDLNQFRLHRFLVVDLFAAHPIASQLEVTVAAENILNRRIETAATPVITLGQPRAFRVGVRYGFRR
ncbi:MAG: TonB-dependent receptor [Acidobacteriota bacterium]|nr:TonB-dependent receptor [Acidobacteriota bacterium]